VEGKMFIPAPVNRDEENKLADFLLLECRERGELLTNLKLQKLIYYADAWNLVIRKTSLVSEDFEAWVHGPVLPSQFHRFKEYRWKPIDRDIEAPNLSQEIITHLKEIVDVFGSESAVALELMTHRERPWIEARGDLAPTDPSNAKISKETMRVYYSTLA
jgi:uncharacterized phage-associated protein